MPFVDSRSYTYDTCIQEFAAPPPENPNAIGFRWEVTAARLKRVLTVHDLLLLASAPGVNQKIEQGVQHVLIPRMQPDAC